MPEEINRILIDDLSDLFFVTEKSGIDHLLKENKNEDNIHFVGNTMIDSLVNFRKAIESSKILSTLNASKEYGLMTFHRPSNVDYIELEELIKTISLCSNDLQIIYIQEQKNLLLKKCWDAIIILKILNMIHLAI